MKPIISPPGKLLQGKQPQLSHLTFPLSSVSQTSHNNVAGAPGTAQCRRTKPGDLQVPQPTCPLHFSQQGVLISVKSVRAMALLTQDQLVTYHKSRCWWFGVFFCKPSTQIQVIVPTFIFNESHPKFLRLCDVFISCASFTSSATSISTLPSALSKSFQK